MVPRVEEMDLSLRWKEFSGQHNKKEEVIQREIQRSIGSLFRVVSHNTDWWMHLQSFLKPGKQPSERTTITQNWEQYRPTIQTGKPHTLWSIDESTQNDLV